MLANEFVSLTGYQPSAEEWQTINLVYTFHPMIPDVGGKEKLASLFVLGGVGLLRDMEPTAREAADLDSAIHAAKVAEENARGSMRDLIQRHKRETEEAQAAIVAAGRKTRELEEAQRSVAGRFQKGNA